MENYKLFIEILRPLIDLHNKTKEQIRKIFIENEILKLNNPWMAYYFSIEVKKVSLIQEFRKLIIDSNDPNLNFLFAKSKYEPAIIEHGEVIIHSNNPYLNYQYAKCFPSADTIKHGEVVIASGNLKLNYLFAQNVSGADILSHGKVIIESKDLEYNYLFARDIPNAELLKHAEVIIDSNDYQYNFEFARDVCGADIERHITVLTNAKNDLIRNKINREFNNHIGISERLDRIFTQAKYLKLQKAKKKFSCNTKKYML